MKFSCGHPLYWHGCYRNSYDLIAPDSYAHPAKMAPALCFRILEHLEELGLLHPGDTVLDPMAGTGLTNIVAAAKGYASISVELEEKFIGFQKYNKDYAERKLFKKMDWQIIQGDSRRLSELVREGGTVGVTSPPYGEAGDERPFGGLQNISDHVRVRSGRKYSKLAGTSETNIGNLPDRPLKSIMSPPYEEMERRDRSTDASFKVSIPRHPVK